MNNPLIWSAIVLLLAYAPKSPNTWEFKHSIRPGHGIGVLNLGWSPQQVRSAMWNARAVPMLTDKKGIARPYYDSQAKAWVELYQADPIRQQYASIFKVFYRDHKVVQLAVSSDVYETKRGARARHMSSEWQERHPSLQRCNVVESWGGRVRPYDSPMHGFAVTYIVFKTGREAIHVQDIIVHYPNAPLLIESARHEGDIEPPAKLEPVKRRMLPGI